METLSVLSVLLEIIFIYMLYVIYDWYSRRPWVASIHRKAVFITGCDTGFGRELARSLYRKGVFVYAGCFTESGASSLRAETGARLLTLIVDVSKADSIKKAAQFVRGNLPQDQELWGIVNNAGIAGNQLPVEFLSRADFQQIMEVNLFGVVDVVSEFLPLIKKSRGRIVNMASIAGDVGSPLLSSYVASKFAVKGYTESLRQEKASWGIKVSTIQPAFFKTNILNVKACEQRVQEKWARASPETKAEYGDDYAEKVVEALDNLLKQLPGKETDPDLSAVIGAYEHALFSVKPRAVYYPGLQAKIIKALHTMHHRITDKLAEIMPTQPKNNS